MGYQPISFVRGGYVSDMNRLGFKEGGVVSEEELTTSVPISKESQILVDNETVPFVDRIINPQDYLKRMRMGVSLRTYYLLRLTRMVMLGSFLLRCTKTRSTKHMLILRKIELRR
jgi:hypothetical protein